MTCQATELTEQLSSRSISYCITDTVWACIQWLCITNAYFIHDDFCLQGFAEFEVRLSFSDEIRKWCLKAALWMIVDVLVAVLLVESAILLSSIWNTSLIGTCFRENSWISLTKGFPKGAQLSSMLSDNLVEQVFR